MIQADSSRWALGRLVPVLLLFGACAPARNGDELPSAPRKVAMVVPVTINTFEKLRDGCREALAREGIGLSFYSAEGSAHNFDSVVSQALRGEPRILITVGTQMTTTVFGPQFESRLPVEVASSITEPGSIESLVEVGIDPPRKKPVAIVSDMPEEDLYAKAAELIVALKPEVRTVGIPFNEGEINSANTANALTRVLKAEGIAIVTGQVRTEEDVVRVVEDLIRKGAKMIVIPHDKQLTKGAAAVVKIAEESPDGPLPVFSLEEGTVDKDGATLAVSVNYGELGALTGQVCLDILAGKDPASMPVRRLPRPKIFVNRRALEKARVQVPEAFLKESVVF